MLKILVFISGGGSNLKAIIDSGIKISGVVSSDSEAYGITRAISANIPILDINDIVDPDLIILAGYMKILSGEFVEKYNIINIHPSLLPKYKGLNTHKRALDNNDKEHGLTIHRVIEELDSGEILYQHRIPVLENETVESLKERVLYNEHIWYPVIINEEIKRLENDRK